MKRVLVFFLLVFFASISFANSFFNGSAGVRIDSKFYDREEKKTDTKFNLSSFFAGQISFSDNLFFRGEFSLTTNDLFSEAFFSRTDATFGIDELSFTYREKTQSFTNYLNAYAGNYEPIGNDVFLQRYLGNESIASKLTDSWLGTANSSINPVFSFGISNVAVFTAKPMALGLSILGSKEIDNNGKYAFSGNVRYALTFTYFTLDASVGFGSTIEKSTEGLFEFTTPFMRMGATALIGNNNTRFSLLTQLGTSFLQFNNKNSGSNKENFYLIFEPRIKAGSNHIHISVYDLPQRTVPLLYSVRDSFGIDLLYYNDYVYIKGKKFTVGANTAISFPSTNLLAITGEGGIVKNGMTWEIAPFISTNFMSGEVKLTLEFEPMKIDYINKKLAASARNAADMFRVSIGYRARF